MKRRQRSRAKETLVERWRVDFLIGSKSREPGGSLHAMIREGIRRGVVLGYHVRRAEKVSPAFPEGG